MRRSALIDDFVALGFLPAGCDRGLIIPVMDRVLSPYLRGGGAAAFNFQALSQVRSSAVHDVCCATSRTEPTSGLKTQLLSIC